MPRELLFASFGRDGLVLHERARGRDDEEVVTTHAEDDTGRLVVRPPRSIRRETRRTESAENCSMPKTVTVFCSAPRTRV